MEKLNTRIFFVPWKVETCSQGEACWCRMIVPVEPILDEEGEEMYIVGSGAMTKAHAEYIVDLHNHICQNKNEQ